MNKQEFKVKLEDLLEEMKEMSKADQMDSIYFLDDWTDQLPNTLDANMLCTKIDELFHEYYMRNPIEIISQTITYLHYVDF